MATEAKQKWDGADSSGKRQRDKAPNQERLMILRLDLNTIMEQLKILGHEMEQDPCLSTDGTAIILSLIDALNQELEETRLRIRKLNASTPA